MISAAASYAQDTTDTKSDTAAVITGKYYGFGAGLSLGAIPLFSMWKNALLDSLSRIGIPPSFGSDTSAGNTGNLRHNVIEAPEEFNFFIPFQISIYRVKENSSASIGLSFFYNAKQFQAEIVPSLDTSGRTVNIYETMKFYSLTIEASWQAAIPPEYFSIKGSQKTFVSLALGLSPAQYVTRYGDVTATEGDTRMQAVADTVKKKMMPDFSANGASASWRVGISTLKSLQKGSALEMGLYYSGTYSGYFFRDGNKVMKSDIYIGNDEIDNPLSFFSNRIDLKVTYLIPVKKETTKGREEQLERPVQQDSGKDAEAQQDDKGQSEQQLQRDDMNDSNAQQDNQNDSENQPEQQIQRDDSEEEQNQQVQPEEAQSDE
jgi:hypothetical protein